jgi:hypothetical protein
MRKDIPLLEERQFITKEFAAAMAGKVPSPYLRLHDHVQKRLSEVAATLKGQSLSQTAYYDRMIHFWREVSLAGLPRSGRGLDECYALLFESAFDLAEAEPEWALECLAEKQAFGWGIVALTELARHIRGNEVSHLALATSFTILYAPWREREQKWNNELCVAFLGDQWFWAAILCGAGIEKDHPLWRFRCDLSNSSTNGWRDNGRLNLRLIREAPRRAQVTPRIELMAHPMLRLARLKYSDEGAEQELVLRFLNARCIAEGFESEEDYVGSDLTLAQWVRDARSWATKTLKTEPQMCAVMFEAAGKDAMERTRTFYRSELGAHPGELDSLDVTAALIRWAKRRRGFEISRYRAELWEFVVEVVDAALWLGWLFPSTRC